MNVETFNSGFVQLSNVAAGAPVNRQVDISLRVVLVSVVFLTLKVLEDLRSVQPGPEAGQASVSDLFPALVCDHVAVLLHNHQFGHSCDLVALPQLTKTEKKRDKKRDSIQKDACHNCRFAYSASK